MDQPKRDSRGMQFILSSFESARNRLSGMKSEGKLRDANEIWETYCDIEQAIEVAKFVFGLHDRLGEIRRLSASSKNDPTILPMEKLISKYESVDSKLREASEAAKGRRGEEAVEMARRARDDLKILLLGRSKSDKFRTRALHSTRKEFL